MVCSSMSSADLTGSFEVIIWVIYFSLFSCVWSSRSEVSRPPSPLRTVHESFPSHGSSFYKSSLENQRVFFYILMTSRVYQCFYWFMVLHCLMNSEICFLGNFQFANWTNPFLFIIKPVNHTSSF